MLQPIPIPGLFITGTDTDVGKTVIAGAIANYFLREQKAQKGGQPRLSRKGGMSPFSSRVAVSKPVATGCVRRREGLVSEDAEFLASCADARFPLDVICPQRYKEPLAPAVAAERAKQPLDWTAIDRSLQLMSRQSDVIIVEGVGGILVPLDARHTVLDTARWLRLPAVIVARAGLGTINHTLLTIEALRNAGVSIAGVVINRYPPDTPATAEETNPRAIEKYGKVPILAIVPNEPALKRPPLPETITSPIDMVDWETLARP
jgi:dethiobiotin synthetase